MNKFIWICMGGAVGTGIRYWLSGWTLKVFGPSFPYSTLTVNIIGSLLIGVILYVGLNTELIPPTMRIVLATGVMGGLTTYSSFNYEMLQYFRENEWLWGMLYFFMMTTFCMIAGTLGFAGAKWWVGR